MAFGKPWISLKFSQKNPTEHWNHTAGTLTNMNGIPNHKQVVEGRFGMFQGSVAVVLGFLVSTDHAGEELPLIIISWDVPGLLHFGGM